MSTLKFKSEIEVPGIHARGKDKNGSDIGTQIRVNSISLYADNDSEQLNMSASRILQTNEIDGYHATKITPDLIELISEDSETGQETATLYHSGLTLKDNNTGKITRLTSNGVWTNSITRQNASRPIVIDSQEDTPVDIKYLQSTQATVGYDIKSIFCALTATAVKGESISGTGASTPCWQASKEISIDNGYRLISYNAYNEYVDLKLDQSKRVLTCDYNEPDSDVTLGDTKTVIVNIHLYYGYKLPEELDKIHTQIDEMQLTISTEKEIKNSASGLTVTSIDRTGEVNFSPHVIGNGKIIEYGSAYVLNGQASIKCTYQIMDQIIDGEWNDSVVISLTPQQESKTSYDWSATITLGLPESATGFTNWSFTLTGLARLPYTVQSSLSDALSYIINNMN